MTQEFENQLKQKFAELDEELPSSGFTPRVMSELLKPRRREHLLRSSAILAALAFLWFSFPNLKAVLRIAAASTHDLLYATSESLTALSHTPVVYIYGTALGGYLLLRLVRKLQIRLM
jgi:hypothetical protein